MHRLRSFILHCAKLDAGVVAAVVSGGRKPTMSATNSLEALHPVGSAALVLRVSQLPPQQLLFSSLRRQPRPLPGSRPPPLPRPDESGDNTRSTSTALLSGTALRRTARAYSIRNPCPS